MRSCFGSTVLRLLSAEVKFFHACKFKQKSSCSLTPPSSPAVPSMSDDVRAPPGCLSPWKECSVCWRTLTECYWNRLRSRIVTNAANDIVRPSCNQR
jgi:hypothetical protein